MGHFGYARTIYQYNTVSNRVLLQMQPLFEKVMIKIEPLSCKRGNIVSTSYFTLIHCHEEKRDRKQQR